MNKVSKEVLGFNVPMEEYGSLKEAIAHAGGEEQLLAQVNGWLHAHGTFGDGRSVIEDVVRLLTGVPFATTKKTVDGKEVSVRDPKDTTKIYVARALASKPIDKAKIEAEVAKRAAGGKHLDGDGKEAVYSPIKTDASPVTRSGSGGKLAKKYTDAASKFIANPAALKSFSAKLTKAGISYTPDADPAANALALARACKAWSDAQDPFAV